MDAISAPCGKEGLVLQFVIEQVPNIILTIFGFSFVRAWIHSRFPKIKEGYLDGFLFLVLIIGFAIGWIIQGREAQQAARQQQIIDSMREYSVVARLNPHGVTGMAGQGLKETPHSRLAGLEETWILHENNWSPKCDDPSIEKSREVVTSLPQFPWTHFLLAVCLREKGDQAWRGYTERAVQIFEHTTSLADHHSVHDKALKKLRELLNTK